MAKQASRTRKQPPAKKQTLPELWQWNNDFLLLEQNHSEIILKNDHNGALVSLSQAEYDFLRYYAENNEYESVCAKMSDYLINQELYEALTEKARQLELVIQSGRTKNSAKKAGGFKLAAYFLFVRFVEIIAKLSGLKLKAECNGNLRFFKLCSLDLEKTFIHKVALSKRIQTLLLPAYLVLLALLLGLFWLIPGAGITFSGFGISRVPILLFFILLVLSIFVCLFVHELGHYLCYMRYGGRRNSMGIGLMFIVFPVLYTHIEQVHLWQNKYRKIKLSAAGIFMDILVLLVLLNVLSHYHAADLFALIIACLFYYYLVQIVTNLNVFFPGTDGYYIFEDFIGQERLFGRSYECFKNFFQRPRSEKFTLVHSMLLLYFFIACINISLYWIMITALMSFPLWSNMVLY